MLAWVGRLLPYSDQIANHSNHTSSAAFPFSSISLFIRSKDGLEMVEAIHGDNGCSTFYWSDALPNAKLSHATGPLLACVGIMRALVFYR